MRAISSPFCFDFVEEIMQSEMAANEICLYF